MSKIFTTCIITAGNKQQADNFKKMLDRRISHGLYPREIEFAVFPDPPSGHIGSGGATLLALYNYFISKQNSKASTADLLNFFKNRRILMIHAGGESRRLPCFAPEGKLFAPIPVESSSIIPPVVLDLQLSLFLKYPWNDTELVITSGDVAINFEMSQVNKDRNPLYGYAAQTSFEQGSRHGVYKFDIQKGVVDEFYQKESVAFLEEHAAIEGTKKCALDIGLVALNEKGLEKFIQFGCLNKKNESIFDRLQAGKENIDLYLEVLTAALKNINLQEYIHRMGSSGSKCDPSTLEIIYNEFHSLNLSGQILSDVTFLHVGSLPDFIDSCSKLIRKPIIPFYNIDGGELDPIETNGCIVYNSYSSVCENKGHELIACEGNEELHIVNCEGLNFLTGVQNFSINNLPKKICIDERQFNSKTVRIVYGISDTFKKQKNIDQIFYCNIKLNEWLEVRGLTINDIWPDEQAFGDLLQAKLFTISENNSFTQGYWDVNLCDSSWRENFKTSPRFSIIDLNKGTDPIERESKRIAIRSKLLAGNLEKKFGWTSISKSDFDSIVSSTSKKLLNEIFLTTEDELLKVYRKELLSPYIESGNKHKGESNVRRFSIQKFQNLQIGVKDDQIVWSRSPVRLDLAGGWTDTPPYTYRYGGAVVNVAVNLNGQPPIQVFCKRNDLNLIRIHSIDLGITQEISNYDELLEFTDPTSPLSLPKAALCLLGLDNKSNQNSLRDKLKLLGSGIDLTLLCAVPKGSGLGTSSILGATIIAALSRFFNVNLDKNELFRLVLDLEQMLTTGGGWQDQIGGVIGGVKYIQSERGLNPNPLIEHLDPFLFTDYKTTAKFTLFYTGFTRLAKNILQEVVTFVNQKQPSYLFTLEQVKNLAIEAKKAIGSRNIEKLSDVIQQSWEANCLIHPSSTNREINEMLKTLKPFYKGVKLLGAGGGGYCLFISDSNSQADELKNMLVKHYESNRARLVDFTLNQVGNQTTVS